MKFSWFHEFSKKILVIKHFYSDSDLNAKQVAAGNRRREHSGSGYGAVGYGSQDYRYNSNNRGDNRTEKRKINDRLPQISLAVIADTDKYEIGLIRIIASKAVSQLRSLLH